MHLVSIVILFGESNHIKLDMVHRFKPETCLKKESIIQTKN